MEPLSGGAWGPTFNPAERAISEWFNQLTNKEREKAVALLTEAAMRTPPKPVVLTRTQSFKRAVGRAAELLETTFEGALWCPLYALHDRMLDTGLPNDAALAASVRERPAAAVVNALKELDGQVRQRSHEELAPVVVEFGRDPLVSVSWMSFVALPQRAPNSYFRTLYLSEVAVALRADLTVPFKNRYGNTQFAPIDAVRDTLPQLGADVRKAWDMTVKPGGDPLEVAP